MRRIAPAALAAGAVSAAALAMSPVMAVATTLARAQGRARVLILFAPAPGDPRLTAEHAALAADPAGLAARDLHEVRVAGGEVDGLGEGAAALRARFGVAPNAFAVRLVGKDGHVALAQATPIAARDLFAAIDAMPMRQDELRRRR